MATCKSNLLINRFEECEKYYLSKKQFLNAVRMYVKLFNFHRAFEIAKNAKENSKSLEWLIDYVLLKRKKYMTEVVEQEEIDEIFRNSPINKSYEEVRQLKKSFENM